MTLIHKLWTCSSSILKIKLESCTMCISSSRTSRNRRSGIPKSPCCISHLWRLPLIWTKKLRMFRDKGRNRSMRFREFRYIRTPIFPNRQHEIRYLDGRREGRKFPKGRVTKRRWTLCILMRMRIRTYWTLLIKDRVLIKINLKLLQLDDNQNNRRSKDKQSQHARN